SSAEAAMSGAGQLFEIWRIAVTRRRCGARQPGASASSLGWRRVGLGALFLIFLADAAPSLAQTLTQALAEAYNTNPQLLAQRALLRATDEQVPQALSFWRPTVNFTGQAGIATTSLETPATTAAAIAAGKTRVVDHAITRPNLLEFQLTQPVYRGGRTEA